MKKILLICQNISNCMDVKLGLDNIRNYAMQQDDLKYQLDIEVLSLGKDYFINNNIGNIVGKTPDLLGLSTFVWNVYDNMILAERIKKLLPEIKIIFGGPQVSDIHWDIMQISPYIDGIIRGEGEITFTEVMRFWLKSGDFYNEDIQGFSFRGYDGNIIHNPDRPPIVDLDIIPSRYKNYKADPNVIYTFETTRGCYNMCGYCSYGSKPFRKHSIKYVFDEIEYMAEAGVKTIYILDSSFTVNHQWLLRISRKLSDCGIRYMCCANAEEIDADMMDILLETGVHSIEFGLQTTNPAALEIMNRNLDMELYKRNVEMVMNKCVGMDIKVGIDVICGLPGDNLKTFCQSMDFAYSLKPHGIGAVPLILLPCTDFFANHEKYGFVYTPFSYAIGNVKNYFSINKFGLVLENMTFSREELKIGHCICQFNILLQDSEFIKLVYEKLDKDNITFTQFFNKCNDCLPEDFYDFMEKWEDVKEKQLKTKSYKEAFYNLCSKG